MGARHVPDKHANPVLASARRVVLGIVGMTLLLLGLIFIFTPGPAIVVLTLALVILGAEFSWARRWLRKLEALARGDGGGPPSARPALEE
jgi:hypothetical protein